MTDQEFAAGMEQAGKRAAFRNGVLLALLIVAAIVVIWWDVTRCGVCD